MDDIKRSVRRPRPMAPKRPLSPVASAPKVAFKQPKNPVEPASPEKTVSPPEPPKKSRVKLFSIVLGGLVLIVAFSGVAAYAWYTGQLSPIAPSNKQDIRATIVSGMSTKQIASLLRDKNLIRSREGFEWYVRLNHADNSLKPGAYSLNQAMSLPDIVAHIESGKTDTFDIMFLPGATVAEDKKVLLRTGYSEKEVDEALAATYDHPVFASKPAGTDLEGYIYGETYRFPVDATAKQVLKRTFDQLYKVVKENNLEEKFQAQGLTLYQGITLASIVQREVADPADAKAVAGVFFNRLKANMTLGSDVTYQYAADKTGQARDPSLDSPYNTRIHKGLPPGPISAPGLSSLLAVADPTVSDYLYFLSGDDDKMYYGKTQAEHDQNILEHCAKKCQIL